MLTSKYSGYPATMFALAVVTMIALPATAWAQDDDADHTKARGMAKA